ncbi:MAG: class I SAM-dependent methyltransferase [Bdellovibrionaceae bacterium]|nr:class I SAM-dependent methyltransferase [Pseudobdellovibrionaceae bacterium]
MNKIYYPESSYKECFELEEKSFWFQHRNSVVEKLLDKYSKNKHITDIGGGNGFMSLHLQNKGYQVTLIEPGATACENAKQRGLSNVIQGTIEDIELKKPIETAICCDVLEHIENPIAFLKNIYKKMQPGGVLLITVPAYSFLWSASDVEAQHFKRYNSKTLKEELTGTGFETIYFSYFFSYLVPLIFLFRTLPFKLKGLSQNFIKSNHQKRSKEHFRNNVITNVFIFFNRIELFVLKKNVKTPLGGSLVLVAKKLPH